MMKANRIAAGFMALFLVLGVAVGTAMARGGGHGGGYGGTPMMHRGNPGGGGAAGTREHRQEMVREHREATSGQHMEQQLRHESTRRVGEPRRHEGDHNSQPAETRQHRMDGSGPTEHPEGGTPRGPSDHASETAHEAVAHHGEGTGTASAVHDVNSSQSHEEMREQSATRQ
jgi:hypothetical protein